MKTSTTFTAPLLIVTAMWFAAAAPANASAAELLAGVGRADITEHEAGPAKPPLYAKALVLKSGDTTIAIITVDAVAIGEIGHIKDDYLGKVRGQMQSELGIRPGYTMFNASHCHGIVCRDVAERTFQAVKQATESMVPVHIGVGIGHEDRVMENRRLKLKSGKTIDVRHAYSLPPDEEVAEVGPVDPTIGVLRLDRKDGRTLAVVYNFACHPIQGVASGANTADMTGFASEVIEDHMSDGTMAFFLQGCGGDINPIGYKDADYPRDAEPLGNMLGLSTLKAARKIETKNDDRLKLLNEVIQLPRADLAQRILAMEADQQRLLTSLRGTSLDLKTFLPLAVKYKLDVEFPSASSYRYLHEEAIGRHELSKLDARNRRNIEQYVRNIQTMEQLTRLNTNLALLRKHQTRLVDSGKRTIDVEVVGVRIGDFVMITFPGELTVPIGLNIKNASPHEHTFVAGYTNGYIYYCPTAEQLRNRGNAQEDSDCLVAPAWQKIFEDKAAEMLKRL